MHTQSRKGFTLIEIIISMMFLSFGIMGVIALFFVGVNNGNLSIKNQKATIIALEVRDALLASLKYPRTEVDPVDPSKTYTLYRLEMPGTIDTAGGGPNFSMEDDKEVRDEDDPKIINGFYFQISDDPKDLKNEEQILHEFTSEEPIDKRVLDLPYEAITFENAQIKQQTWRYKSYRFMDEDSDFDEDDAHFYSFRIIIRRSVTHSTKGTLSPGDWLVATVYVFKQFDVSVLGDENGNVEKTEYMKYNEDYGYPTFEIDQDGNTDEGIQPILKYEFYVPA